MKRFYFYFLDDPSIEPSEIDPVRKPIHWTKFIDYKKASSHAHHHRACSWALTIKHDIRLFSSSFLLENETRA